MAYATTARRKTETTKQPTWKWDSQIRMEQEAREKQISEAARRFRKSI
jgi:hypothetical protein